MEVDTPPIEEQKPVPTTTTPVKDETPAPMDTKEESPVKTEPMQEDAAIIKSEPTTDSSSVKTESAEAGGNAEDKPDVKTEDDATVETEEAGEADKTVNLDTEDTSLLQAPVLVPQPKVVSPISAYKSISLFLLFSLSLFILTFIENKFLLCFGMYSNHLQPSPKGQIRQSSNFYVSSKIQRTYHLYERSSKS